MARIKPLAGGAAILSGNGHHMRLSPAATSVLFALMVHRFCTTQTIHDALWTPYNGPLDRRSVVSSHITHLRAALAVTGGPTIICSHGRGYYLGERAAAQEAA